MTSAFAQETPYNHPELKWESVETEHFAVHFHQGTERTAREVAGIAEEVYQPITEMYDYRPDGRVHFVIRDYDDYSNGASYYYDQKIEIWATPLDFELRGQHHWLYDVVTHEFTHMIQLGASRKGPRWLPGVYLQAIDYEPEKRPDVLYGYPNRIASWPIAGTVIPMWFAEGTAQYQALGVHHDWWDSHRDMLLRVAALEDRLLTPTEMDVFGKNTLGSEYVYNQGYALVRYIADHWGFDHLMRLSKAMRSPTAWDFSTACRRVLGVSEDELFKQWKVAITKDYCDLTATVRNYEYWGSDIIRDEGFGNLFPAVSPDGLKVVFISNKGKDYLSLGKPVVWDAAARTISETDCPANSRIAWSPDGRFWLYARQKGENKYGSHFNDLFLWDIARKREIRLTRDARLSYPAFSPDGKQIIAVRNGDGSHNLALVTLPDSIKGDDIADDVNWKMLTDFNDGQQIYSPAWSPDGSYIICSAALMDSRGSGRDLCLYVVARGEFVPYIASEFDERDPAFSPDGQWLYWSDDRTGIFNIYRMKFLGDGPHEPITNVIGGAFMTTVAPQGNLYYCLFTTMGYGIYADADVNPLDASNLTYMICGRERQPFGPRPQASSEKTAYSSPFTQLSVLPRIAWDYGKFKPGFYAYTGDILDKVTLFGGATVNGDGERDLFATAEYRMLYPTLFVEAYNFVRKNRQQFDDPFVIVGEHWIDSTAVPIYGTYAVKYRFNLAEYDVGARIPLKRGFTASLSVRAPAYKAALWFDDGGTFDYTYFKGSAYILRLDSDLRALSATSDIHPTGGWKGWLELAHEENRFLDSFRVDLDKGLLKEVYQPYNYIRFEADVDYYWKLFDGVTLNPRLIGGLLSDDAVDPFFHLYAGGLPGLRGYSFYSLGGSRKAVGRLSLRFPILGGIDRAWGPFYLDRIHGALFGETGDAWSGEFNSRSVKKDAGFELRTRMFSWYGFPTDIQFTGAYGFDRFRAPDDPSHTQYGRGWRWYFTLLFDFL